MSRFSANGRGFHMTFENGLTVSVQFGPGNYCENHDAMDFSIGKIWSSKNAEVAVLQNLDFLNANYFLPEESADWCDDVVGQLNTSEVVDLLVRVRNATEEDIRKASEETYLKSFKEES